MARSQSYATWTVCPTVDLTKRYTVMTQTMRELELAWDSPVHRRPVVKMPAKHAIEKGWFLPETPGSGRGVTVGLTEQRLRGFGNLGLRLWASGVFRMIQVLRLTIDRIQRTVSDSESD